MSKKTKPYSNCVSYDADENTSRKNHHFVKTIYFIKPDLSRKNLFAVDERDFRVDRKGNFKSSCNGLYPINKTKEQAIDAVTKIAEQMKKNRKLQSRKAGFKRKNKPALDRLKAQSNEVHSDDEAQQIRKRFVKKAMAKREREAKKITNMLYF